MTEEVHDQEQRRVDGVAHQEHRRSPLATEIGAKTQKTTLSSGISCPSRVDGVGAERRRRLQQLLLRPDRVLARGEGHLVVAGERERPRRAGLDAEAAHDAAQVVDLVVLRVPLARAHRLRRDRCPRPRPRSRRPGTRTRRARSRCTSPGRSRGGSAGAGRCARVPAAARSPSGTARCCRARNVCLKTVPMPFAIAHQASDRPASGVGARSAHVASSSAGASRGASSGLLDQAHHEPDARR